MTAPHDAASARRQLETLLFCAQKVRSNLSESIGTDPIGQGILADLQPWLFDSKKEFVSRLYDRLQDPDPVDPMTYRNFMTIPILLCPIVLIGMSQWGTGALPVTLDELPAGLTWGWEADDA